MLLTRVLIAGALLLAVALPSWAASRLDASTTPNLTGTWTIDFPAPINLTCASSLIKQHGAALAIGIPCPPLVYLGDWFTGSIDKATGNFSVSVMFFCDYLDVPFTLTGTASPDGNTISGTWYTECFFFSGPGTFSGERTGPATITFEPPTLTSTATPPPTAIPTPPPAPVGGISRDPSAEAAPAQSTGSSGASAGLLAFVIAATTTGALLLGGSAWYVRRRLP
jgi:hypothetical protein